MNRKETSPRRRARIQPPAAASIGVNTGLDGSPGNNPDPLPGPEWILLNY